MCYNTNNCLDAQTKYPQRPSRKEDLFLMKIDCQISRTLSQDAAMIREAVFIKEQGFQNEFDSTDNVSVHLVLYANAAPAAVARLFSEENDGTYTIGRIAVLPEFRGLHLGSRVLSEAEKCAVENGAKRLILSAQCRVRPFYEKNGYKAVGNVYLDENCPHIRMEKLL